MSRFKLFAALAGMMAGMGPNSIAGRVAAPPISRKRLKRMRPKRYKPAFSMGYRGFPKSTERPGRIPAPTIDQVRHRERKYGQRIHVKQGGIMYFKSDGLMWTADEAKRRLEKSLRSVC